jgi:hypothetical protein
MKMNRYVRQLINSARSLWGSASVNRQTLTDVPNPCRACLGILILLPLQVPTPAMGVNVC